MTLSLVCRLPNDFSIFSIILLTAHRDLCVKKILHRDISYNNILLNNDICNSEERPGLLIDFDYAAHVGDAMGSAFGTRTVCDYEAIFTHPLF